MARLKRLPARLSIWRLGREQTEDEISPERFRVWRLREETERGSEVVQVSPVQLQ